LRKASGGRVILRIDRGQLLEENAERADGWGGVSSDSCAQPRNTLNSPIQ
jgi:hypothetical protein